MAKSTFQNVLVLAIVLVNMLFCTFKSIEASKEEEEAPGIHDLLRRNGLPAGLLPKEVKSYKLEDDGKLEVHLERPCLTKYENRVIFETVIRGNLSYGALKDVVGLSQEELFLWLPVKDIIVDDPNSGLILFDIVVAHKQLSLSLFDDPPNCKPSPSLSSSPSGSVWNGGRKEKGFAAER